MQFSIEYKKLYNDILKLAISCASYTFIYTLFHEDLSSITATIKRYICSDDWGEIFMK